MKDRLLSVIITAYNAENTIERCVASVFESTPCELVKLLEIIVVDDASEDKTTDKLNSFTDRIELVRLQTNSGCIAKTRNIGLDYASGKYITFLDSDDWYENGAVGKILGYISEYSPDIIRFGYTNVYPGGKREIPKSNPSKLEFISGGEMNRKIYPQFITGIGLNSVCLAAFKRELSVHRFPENFLTAEDAAFSIETYTKAANVFEAKKGTPEKTEQIKAVSVGIAGENTICTVEIYTNVPEESFDPEGTIPAASKTVHLEYGGFRCIELDEPVEIEKGSSFAVVAEVQNGYITLNESIGKSYVYTGYWMPQKAAPRIKAFTKTERKAYVEFISESQVKVFAENGVRYLALARYEAGVLKNIRIEPIDFDLVKEKTLPLPDGWERTENTVYKAFLWESLNSLNPLCNVAEF